MSSMNRQDLVEEMLAELLDELVEADDVETLDDEPDVDITST